jgi:hypothetical protein
MTKTNETYWDILNELKLNPHELFKDFVLTEGNQSKEKNIEYFLDNFEQIKSLNLDNKNKKLIYLALTTTIKSEVISIYFPAIKSVSIDNVNVHHLNVLSLTQQNNFAFNRLPFYLSFKRSTETLLNTINYFNDEINDHIKSDRIKSQIDSNSIEQMSEFLKEKNSIDLNYDKEKWSFSSIITKNFVNYILNHKGIEKLEALLCTKIFLPYQKKELSIALEHYHLENQLTLDSNSVKSKIKI